jgi:tetratricopeptide (TPR) repeat protein
MGEYSKALSSHEKALEIYQKTLPANHPHLATSYNNTGLVYYNMGEYSRALSYYERALDILQRSLPPNHPHLKRVKESIEIVKKKCK